jgi:hypothetical protein
MTRSGLDKGTGKRGQGRRNTGLDDLKPTAGIKFKVWTGLAGNAVDK